MGKINIASFNELEKAEVLQKRLADGGIRSEIYDESKIQKYWFHSEPLAGMKIQVDEKDFEEARRLLEGLDVIEGALHDAVRCPMCKSSRIEYPQFTRKFATPTLIEIFCTIKLLDKEFYCEDCHYTWPNEVHAQPELDILGWPKGPPASENKR